MNKKVLTVLLLLIFSGLYGCQSPEDNNQVEITNLSVTTEPTAISYPAPSPYSAYPYPPSAQMTPTEPLIFKTSEPGKITIHGILLVLDFSLMIPDPNDAIFLVPMDESGGNVSTIPQFTIGNVPQAEVDERNGEFYFTNIEPGLYAVVVLTKGGAQIPTRNFDDGSYAIIDIQGKDRDQTVELDFLTLP